MRNVTVAGGGGRAGEAAGGRIVPGGRAETWPLPAPALAAGGPGLRGPTRQGQRHPGRWHGASGDHGVRLHSGQSFRGTPARPGNRTGTRPAGGREPRLRSAPLHLLSLPGLPAALGSKAGARLLQQGQVAPLHGGGGWAPSPHALPHCNSALGAGSPTPALSPERRDGLEGRGRREVPSSSGPRFPHLGSRGTSGAVACVGAWLSHECAVTWEAAPRLWISVYPRVKRADSSPSGPKQVPRTFPDDPGCKVTAPISQNRNLRPARRPHLCLHHGRPLGSQHLHGLENVHDALVPHAL